MCVMSASVQKLICTHNESSTFTTFFLYGCVNHYLLLLSLPVPRFLLLFCSLRFNLLVHILLLLAHTRSELVSCLSIERKTNDSINPMMAQHSKFRNNETPENVQTNIVTECPSKDTRIDIGGAKISLLDKGHFSGRKTFVALISPWMTTINSEIMSKNLRACIGVFRCLIKGYCLFIGVIPL